MSDWQPAQYLKFQNERTQPSVDLIARIGCEHPKRVIDVGCGPGNSTAVLKARWPQAELCGLDSSPAMIEKARAEDPGIRWRLGDAWEDLSDLGAFDIVFSNAALQWMPDHETLIPKLYGMLCPGGVLAVQVPCVRHLPVYDQIRHLIRQPRWEGFFASPPVYPRHFDFRHYYEIISGLGGAVTIWQTDYIHVLPSHEGILQWYRGSGLRPFLDLLPDEAHRQAFCADYLARIAQAYPVERDGNVLLPFTRIFFLVDRP